MCLSNGLANDVRGQRLAALRLSGGGQYDVSMYKATTAKPWCIHNADYDRSERPNLLGGGGGATPRVQWRVSDVVPSADKSVHIQMSMCSTHWCSHGPAGSTPPPGVGSLFYPPVPPPSSPGPPPTVWTLLGLGRARPHGGSRRRHGPAAAPHRRGRAGCCWPRPLAQVTDSAGISLPAVSQSVGKLTHVRAKTR